MEYTLCSPFVQLMSNLRKPLPSAVPSVVRSLVNTTFEILYIIKASIAEPVRFRSAPGYMALAQAPGEKCGFLLICIYKNKIKL